MKSKNRKKQIVSLLLCAVMFFGFIPQGMAIAFAASDDGLCAHHTEHTAECGYSEGIEGSPCTHEHTEDCYTTITRCAHIHTEACYAEEDAEKETPICDHVCSEEEGCTTEEELSCKHVHDESCGYVEVVEGTPCTYDCEICNAKDSGDNENALTAAKVLELIDKLPTVEELKAMSEDEQREVYNGSYMEVLDAYELLSEEEQEQIDGSERLMALAAFFSSLLIPAEAGTLNEVYLNGEAGNDETGTGAADNPVKTFAKAKELLAKDGTIYISGTVTVSGSESWTLEPDTYGTASVKRTTSFNEVMVLVSGTGGVLTLQNITLDGGSRSLGSTSTVASIVKMEGGSLTLKSGAVLQNNYNTRSGGGIHASNKASIEMQDGAVIQNCGTWTNLFAGGGVALYNSTMNMNGGTITNCRANKGGGVAVIASTFNMSGGEISECTLYDYGTKNTTGLPSFSTESTNAYGCGVVVSNGLVGGNASGYSSFNGTFALSTGVVGFEEGKSVFNLSGGTIKNNGITDFTKTSSNVGAVPMGGGICAIPHDFTNYFDADYSSNTENLEINISGGTISGNGAAYGGGICLMFSPSKLTMTGGTIDNNQAYKDGGGIYIATRNMYATSRPNNTISGGTISNNHAGGLFSMNGNVYGVTSPNRYGGGICLDGWTNGKGFQGGATLEVSGEAKIEGNIANLGAGVAAKSSSKLTVQGGNIINNSAEWYNAKNLGMADNYMNVGYGGGIYSANNLYIYGGKIAGNTSVTKFVKNNSKTATYGNGVFCKGYIYMHGSPTFGENDDVAFQGGSSNYYIWIDKEYTPGDTPVSVTSAYYYTSTEGYWYSARGVEIISDEYTNGYQTGTILVGYSDAAGGQEAAVAAAAAGNFVPSKAMQDASDQSTYTSRAENSEPITIGHSKLWNSSGKYNFLTYKQSVTVTYKANTDQGGSGEDVVKTYEKGSTPAALSNTETKFSNTGHNFTGWNTLPQPTADNEGKAYTADTALESLTSDLVLYAQWEKAEIKYTLTYETNGGDDVVDKDGATVTDSGGNKNRETYAENEIAKLFERITKKTDYEFTGWYSDNTLNNYIPEQELEIEADTTVYAGWGFKFTFNPNGGTMEKPSGNNVTDNGDGTYSVLVTAGKLVAEPTDPTRSGSYTFLGWNTEKDGSGKMWDFDTDTAAEPTTLYAQWKYTGGGDTYINVTAKKEWKLDDGGEKASSVTAVLYKDGVKYDTAELNDSNNWTHTWNNLNDKYTWTVEEETVPENFTSSVERSGNTFTITNDDKPQGAPEDPVKPVEPENPDQPDTPDNPSEPDKPIDDVPQTGDDSSMGLWIALACFSLFGMLLAVFGRKRLYKRCR